MHTIGLSFQNSWMSLARKLCGVETDIATAYYYFVRTSEMISQIIRM